jgi:hypothetical protein
LQLASYNNTSNAETCHHRWCFGESLSSKQLLSCLVAYGVVGEQIINKGILQLLGYKQIGKGLDLPL